MLVISSGCHTEAENQKIADAHSYVPLTAIFPSTAVGLCSSLSESRPQTLLLPISKSSNPAAFVKGVLVGLPYRMSFVSWFVCVSKLVGFEERKG